VGTEAKADVIVGLGGDDVIFGSEDVNQRTAPGDRLCGNRGSDRIRGAVGPDRLDGNAGSDDVDGSFGDDPLVRGGEGDDRVSDCDNELTGGANRLEGGRGSDVMCSDTGEDVILGLAGNDTILDLGCGTSQLFGGEGADHMESYFSNQEGTPCSEAGLDEPSVLIGGFGHDSAIVNQADQVKSVEEVSIR
jgi:Ca2+-binding RTX toxin-like protein